MAYKIGSKRKRQIVSPGKEQAALKRKNMTYYSRVSENKIVLRCCNCMHSFVCSKLNQDGVKLIQWVRQKFSEFSRESQRVFISYRITCKNKEIGINKKMLRVESLETLV